MNRKNIIMLYTCALLFSACDGIFNRGEHMKILTRTENGVIYNSAEIKNDSIRLKLEYTGKIEFNDGKTELTSITRGGYLDYKKNRNTLLAKPTSSGLSVHITRDERPIDPDSKMGRQIIAQAVKDLIYTDSLRSP